MLKQDTTVKIYLGLSVLVIFSTLLFTAFNFNIMTKGQNPWNKPPQSFAKKNENGPGLLWCERRRPMDFMAEPSNAISNFAYFLVGLIMIHVGIYDHLYNQDPQKEKKSLMIQYPAFAYAYGVAACLLGFGSFMWHASNLKPHDDWDREFMHSVVIYPVFYFIFQLTYWFPVSGHVLLTLHYGLKYYLFLFGLPVNSRTAMLYILVTVLGFAIFNGLVLFRTRHLRLQWLILGLLGFLVGWGFWNLEKWPGWCFPDSPIQFHALWHVFTALAMLSLFWYFRSETKRADETDSNVLILQSNSQTYGVDKLIEQMESLCEIFESDENSE
eukprot:gene8353-178_t